ncbi:syntaxin-22-like [Juglans microcarpa x Juglans regia]|uniref:syntaxin-22-like n=1 Tax=Juglans microcarpa x Juglans regia TaxID=2249226 RepID=UPI001B7E3FCF|nr:syntaxin-22-like [Juglans microcarpa x Juglans regia]
MRSGDLEAGGPPQHQQLQQQQDPPQAVASGIFQINTAVSSFSRLVNSLGTPKDTLELRDRLHKARLHIGELVRDTSAKLKQASGTDQHLEVSAAKKITDAKLAKDFQLVLKEFQKVQKLAVEREVTYAPFVPKEGLPSSSDAHEREDTSSSRSPERRALILESKRQFQKPYHSNKLQSLPSIQVKNLRQDQVVLVDEIILNEAIIEETEQGITEIQQQLIEINEILKDLAFLALNND